MSKDSLKKILLVIFFVSLVLVSYRELKSNLQQIKIEVQNQTKEISTNEQKSEYANKVGENKTNKSIGDWRSVERKDSYNNELQYYSTDNVVIIGDFIEITSRQEVRENKKYTSGLVESTSGYKYGYFEFVMEISEGKGLFPAIWLMPISGEPLPEIDLFEMIGSEPSIFYGVIHFIKEGTQGSDYFAHQVEKKEEYTVALEWTAEALTWYINHEKIYTTTIGVPQEYMYIIINQAIGGNWPGNPDEDIFPNQFKILSSRIESIYKKGRD